MAKTSPSREKLFAAQAARAERINQIEAGELIPAAEVRTEWTDILIQVRTRLLAIPARIAALHPGHPRLIADVEREIHSTLTILAEDEL